MTATALIYSKQKYAHAWGPKPCELFRRCQADLQLRWILEVSGAEAVLEFSLAREQLTEGEEKRYWMKLSVTASNRADAEFSQRELVNWE